jgi:opacity protein-like surface antigen
MMTAKFRRRLVPGALAFLLFTGWAATSRAQGYISPLIGFNFGGDANCPQITNCQDKRLNYGIGLGRMGNVLGFEEEFAYAKDFFGTAPNLSSSVLTVMSNGMFVPNVGPIRPYALLGVGLIRSHVDFTPTSLLLSTDNNNFGWNIGGGVIVRGTHIGARGDIRYFHTFGDQTILGFTLSDSSINFGRASVALMLFF